MADITGTESGETLAGTAGDDLITALGGDDTINAGAGNDTINPGLGKDTVNGEDGDDTIVLTDPYHFVFNGAGFDFDTYNGGNGFDTIEFHPLTSGLTFEYQFGPAYGYSLFVTNSIERLVFASTSAVGLFAASGLPALASVTEVVGGSGRDLLIVSVSGAGAAFTIPSLTLTNWTSSATPDLDGGDMVMLQAVNGNLTLNAFEGLASTQGLLGGPGNETLVGSSGVDMLNGGAGTNTLLGNGGNDILAIVNAKDPQGNITAYTGAGSTFDGGSGTDALSIGGSVNFLGTLTSIEGIHLQPAWTSSLANGNMSQTAAYLTISAQTMAQLPANLELAGSGTIKVVLAAGDTFNASGYVRAPGSSVSLLVDASAAGGSATGSSGNDAFFVGAALSAGDSFDGGAGLLDQLGLQGNYGSPFVLGANTLVNIEMLVLLPGNDTRFGDTAGNLYSYNLATVDANVAAGERLIVSFNQLRAGENVTFDGSAETNGQFLTFAGLGNDAITGGAQDDGFYFGNSGRWGAGDSVTGGAGSDQLGLQGNYSGAGAVTFGASQISGIEMLVLLTGGDARFGNPPGTGYSYDVTMHDGNVAAGEMFYVSANTLRANVSGVTDETLTFNGSAESNGHFTIYSGAAADTLVGGLLADTIYGGDGADTMTGGGGNDTFAYINAAHSTATAMDQILDFATGDQIDLAAIDAITGGANDAFSFIGSGAFSNTAGELRAFDAGGGVWQVQGDIDGNGSADLIIAVTTGVPLAITDFVL